MTVPVIDASVADELGTRAGLLLLWDWEVTMRWLSVLLAATVLAETGSGAEPGSLAFRPAGKGLFDFDTGPLKGRLKVDGK